MHYQSEAEDRRIHRLFRAVLSETLPTLIPSVDLWMLSESRQAAQHGALEMNLKSVPCLEHSQGDIK